ncbi:formate transporter FocA [Shewanella sp.]|uniref:formate transporter FocA n=1 Tax=Shewanella sp. TaxID=50422 RepID=UPI003563906A
MYVSHQGGQAAPDVGTSPPDGRVNRLNSSPGASPDRLSVADEVASAMALKLAKPALARFARALYAGVFIGLAFVFYLTVTTGAAGAPWGLVRLMGALAFSVGLILVVLLNMELFTGTVLGAIPWTEGHIGAARLLKSWGTVFVGNAAGAFLLVAMVSLAGLWQLDGGLWGIHAINTALHKLHHGWWQAFFLGVLCNLLVCLGVWLTFLTKSPGTKALLLVLPVALFVSSGFEHSIANLFLLPLGAVFAAIIPEPQLLAHGLDSQALAALAPANLLVANLIPVTLGNIVGGAVLVGLGLFRLERLGSCKGTAATNSAIKLTTPGANVSRALKLVPASTARANAVNQHAISAQTFFAVKENKLMNTHLSILTVKDILEPATSLEPGMGLWQALEEMHRVGESLCPVTDNGGRLVGVLSAQDAIRGLWAEEFGADSSYCVRDLMQKSLSTLSPDEALLPLLEFWVVNREALFPVSTEGHWLGGQYQAYEERLRGAAAVTPAVLPVVEAGVLKGMVRREALTGLLCSAVASPAPSPAQV